MTKIKILIADDEAPARNRLKDLLSDIDNIDVIAYAIKAFDVNAIDYLLKPIRLERLEAAIDKVRALQPQTSATQMEAMKSIQQTRGHVSIHEKGRVILIPVEDIIYLRAELKYVTVRTDEQEYILEESLTNLELEFSEVFVRLHRNCLVAKQYITGYEKRKDDKGDQHWHAILKGVPDTVAVSRRQQHLIRKT